MTPQRLMSVLTPQPHGRTSPPRPTTARVPAQRGGSHRVSLLGWEFDVREQRGVIDHIFDSLTSGSGGWVVTPNVDILRLARKDPSFGHLIRRASLLLVDGAPLEWAGRLSGQRYVTRVPGSSLMTPTAAEAASRGVPLLLFGGRPGAAETAALVLREAYPGLDVRAYCPPMGFEQDRTEWHRSLDAVAESTGGIVMCGLGAPKQEYVMSQLIEHFDDTWFLGIGGSIDMTAGYVQRAPGWMQRSGLEWVWRLGKEPRRLFRRYVVNDAPFAFTLLAWAVRERLAGTFADGPSVDGPAHPLALLGTNVPHGSSDSGAAALPVPGSGADIPLQSREPGLQSGHRLRGAS